PLHDVAAQTPQGSLFTNALDALGDGHQFETVGEVDDGLQDRGGRDAVREGGDEGAVDLQFGQGDVAERRQGRVTGSEVVQRAADAEFGEFVHDVPGTFVVGDERALGEFDGEPLTSDAV